MKNFLQVVIEKKANAHTYICNGELTTMDGVLSIVQVHSPSLIHIITKENEVTLLECYIPYSNSNLTHLEIRLKRAAKAQV